MSNLTTDQEKALATFKHHLHLPHGGFHTLIIELCREFQLPFQKVRKVVKTSQKSIEKAIKEEFDSITERDLTKSHWLEIINAKLSSLAEQNKPVMENIINNQRYQKVVDAMSRPIENKQDRQDLLMDLAEVYESEIYKPLAAMLHTSILYWKLKVELDEMTKEQRTVFNDYPQFMQATEHLLELSDKVRHFLAD